MTYVPDDVFEQKLIDLGYDDVLDDYVLTSNISSVQSLVFNNDDVSNLTGIEAFTNLYDLRFINGDWTDIDLSIITNTNPPNESLTIVFGNNDNLTSITTPNDSVFVFEIINCAQVDEITFTNNFYLSGSILINSLTDLSVINMSMTAGFKANSQFIYSGQLECLNIANGQSDNLFVGLYPFATCFVVDENSTTSYVGEGVFFNFCNSCGSSAEIDELTTSKNLIQILDMMGRETSFIPNTPLIYVYDDGSTEKVFSVEY